MHVAMGLALLGGYAGVMSLIAIADFRQSGEVIGASLALEIASVGIVPALLGLIAFFRLPRRDPLRIEALCAIGMGLAVAGGLIVLTYL